MCSADGVIAVTPVFNGSYSGLFKLFFDALDEGAMQGRPVLLAATGGTARHSLVIEHAMLPLFYYLKALVATHPVFDYRLSWRRLVAMQAQLLARHLRGELAVYPGITTR